MRCFRPKCANEKSFARSPLKLIKYRLRDLGSTPELNDVKNDSGKQLVYLATPCLPQKVHASQYKTKGAGQPAGEARVTIKYCPCSRSDYKLRLLANRRRTASP